MAVCPDGLPWLSKPAVIHEAVAMLVESAIDAGCSVGYLDDADVSRSGSGEGGELPFWRPPTGQTGVRRLVERLPGRGFGAPEDTVERLLRWLADPTRRVSSGTFVFVLSDYLSPPTEDAWIEALARRSRSRARRDPGSGLGAELPGRRRAPYCRSWTRPAGGCGRHGFGSGRSGATARQRVGDSLRSSTASSGSACHPWFSRRATRARSSPASSGGPKRRRLGARLVP